jgi:hypothetical protein
VHVRNNIVQTTGGLGLVDVGGGQNGVLFQGNDYFPTGAGFRILWQRRTYTSLSDWRAVTGQERLGAESVGWSVDPQLRSAGGDAADDVSPLERFDAYRLQDTSPLIGAGLDLARLFGLDPGAIDYYGAVLPRRASPSVGAHEAAPAARPSAERSASP